ncbi:hypothetical protein GGR56DRAFT_672122 [Xylariaceae sp. FL0804]|nr:hypothetical protein GGR56DRAFT_672122 [Xylariaceae sp. FL0804]
MGAASLEDKPAPWVGGRGAVSTSQGNSQNPPDPETEYGTDDGTMYDLTPEVLRIPFEEAVRDIALEGWEDEWFSTGVHDAEKHGMLAEPKIDFVYNWVNGSDPSFNEVRRPYELDSPLNDKDGRWLAQHGVNRYRDWDELRYSLRSLDAYAQGFVNRIQLLVNSVGSVYSGDGKDMRPQRPAFLRDDEATREHVQVLSQETFFGADEQACLPTFNSLAIESQIHRTPSDTDNLVALSDDMLLGMPHAASDFYSPLFGPVVGFKSDSYNVRKLGEGAAVPSFGEKPFVYYTSFLLNHRFGRRGRHVQAHFGHSVSRAVMQEAMAAFPGPAARGACERFRGESRFQLYPWYAGVHYAIERFREVLLWSLIMARTDENSDGYLDWPERRRLLAALEPGWRQLADASSAADASRPAALTPQTRDRMYYRLPAALAAAGLQPPRVNSAVWTSLDGPEMLRGAKCHDFAIDKCLGDAFASPLSDASSSSTSSRNPDFAAAAVFARLAHQHPACGDCVLKFALAATPRGLEPLLPPPPSAATDDHDNDDRRETVVRALKKYQHTVVDTDAMRFVMVKDAEQAETELFERPKRRGRGRAAAFGQWCLNDDVMTDDPGQVARVRDVMTRFFETLWPRRGRWEKEDS